MYPPDSALESGAESSGIRGYSYSGPQPKEEGDHSCARCRTPHSHGNMIQRALEGNPTSQEGKNTPGASNSEAQPSHHRLPWSVAPVSSRSLGHEHASAMALPSNRLGRGS